MVADRTLLCLFGGSFDPVHLGHIAMMRYLLHAHEALELIVIPAAQSPLKQTSTSFQNRLSMLELALESLPHTRIDTREGTRPSPSYTIDTLQEYRQEYPQQRLAWVMGDDAIEHLPHWKSWSLFPNLVHALILKRSGINTPLPGFQQAQSISELLQKDAGLFLELSNPFFDCASSTLRAWLAARDPRARAFLSDAVYTYMLDHHLYQGVSYPL